jgi:hypothetical protein
MRKCSWYGKKTRFIVHHGATRENGGKFFDEEATCLGLSTCMTLYISASESTRVSELVPSDCLMA